MNLGRDSTAPASESRVAPTEGPTVLPEPAVANGDRRRAQLGYPPAAVFLRADPAAAGHADARALDYLVPWETITRSRAPMRFVSNATRRDPARFGT